MATEVMATEATGNTKPVAFPKSRAFQFTLNQIHKYHTLKTLLTSLQSCDYFISCQEVAPSTGHPHIHIYAHFSTPYRPNKKILAVGAHIEVCRGSPKQNINYIKKDGNILDEIGTMPQQGARTVEELLQLPIGDVPPQYYNVYNKAKSDKENDIDIEEWAKQVKVYYIEGPSGAGKTEMAKQIVRDNKDKYGTKCNMLKYENSFWNGVGSANIAIYDDFRDSHMRASEFVNFIDYNRHTLNIKGGSKVNNYQLIIITSVQRLSEIYKNMSGEPRLQWERRVERISMYDDEDTDNDIEFI